jgi:hypothetical protein
MDRDSGIYVLTVEASIGNIGSEAITDPIWVRAETSRGNDTNIIHTDLSPGDWVDTDFEITFSIKEPACPIEVTVNADYVRFIDECDEDNNEASDDACCSPNTPGI